MANTKVTENVIKDSAVVTAGIADDAVTTAKIPDSAITTAKIADNSVTTAKIPDDGVTTAKIADNQVTLAKMAGLARGKIIYGDSSGNPAALAVGSAGTVLTSDGTDISWAEEVATNYLPLSGGTLTGALVGTSATFSTTIATGGASVTGSNSGAFGYSASTTGDHSFALGYDPTVSGNHSFSFGYQGTVSGNHSALISLDSTARTLSDANTLSIMGGEVGIGTLSAGDYLHLYANNPAIRLEDSDGGYGRVMGVSGNLYYQADEGNGESSSFHRWDIDGTDSLMRLNTDGLAVNSTTTDGSRFYVKVPDSDTVSSALKLSQNNAAGDDRNTLSIKCDGPNNLAIFNSSGTNAGGYAFNSGGTERMRMSAAGRMILGHNASISNGVAAKLQIYNAGAEGSLSLGRWGAVTSPPYLTFMKSRGANVGDNTILNDNDIIGEIRWRAADGVNFNAEAAAIHCRVDGTPGADDMPGELHFQTTADGADSATSKMVIKPNGNVGIGTSDAQTLLELSAHNASGQNTLRFTDEDTGTVANQAIGKIEFYTKDGSGDGASVRSYILSAAEDATPSTYIAFATCPGSSSPIAEAMRIDKDGIVGVGTIDFTDMGSSSYKGLKVGGAVIQDSGGGNGSATWIGNNAYVGGSNDFYFDGGGAASGIQMTTGDINFYTFDGGGGSADAQWSPTARMHIKENGYIGIGTTGPSTKLYVYNAGGGNGDCMTVQSGSTANANVGMILFRDNDQDYCGQITTNGSTNTTTYNANTSDERLKENITDWDIDALSLFKTIEPKEFNFKSQDEGAPKIKGYIAQTEASKFPEAFPTDMSEEEYYSYNPSGMVVYLMKALKEQVAINEALEARITALESS